VSVRLNPIPGWGYNPRDFQRIIEEALLARAPHYYPTVTYTVTREETPEDMEQATSSHMKQVQAEVEAGLSAQEAFVNQIKNRERG